MCVCGGGCVYTHCNNTCVCACACACACVRVCVCALKPSVMMRERISKCQIQQGAAVTEFVGSLPTKAPTFSGDVLGDVLMWYLQTK